ncbi:MAG: Kef family K(+) transporter [Fimbriimonadaceae bacterium]|nr:Kef family K(+) transporter [Fimbriimonadaceae bacterium]
MNHETTLIATIAAGIGLAFVFGLIAAKLRLPLLLGYLVAGMAIGPFTPGFVADAGIASQLAEIGVSLLMFGVGLHFSIKDLLAVRKIAIPGAVAQISVATMLGLLLVSYWGWTWGAGIVFGLCLSIASTVVLLRALKERRLVETVNGRIAVGWLIVEDLVTVIALVVLPAISPALGGTAAENDQTPLWITLAATLGKVTVFVVAMLIIGKKAIPLLLGRVARTGSRELFTLGVLAVALGIAFGAAALFGVSPALGAFFAGVVISESDLSHQAGAEMLPIQEAFTVLFFVSVGMMFDPTVLTQHPIKVVATLFIVLVGKSLASLFIVLLFRYPFATALTISASLAQIGEFSFILVGLGMSLKLVPAEALSIILAVAILSIAVNPLIFSTVEPIDRFLRRFPRILAMLERRTRAQDITVMEEHTSRDHAVMIGYGRVGATVGRALERENIPYVVVDQDRTIIDSLKERGIPTIFGDASRPGVLSHAGLQHAHMLIVATPAKSQAREIVEYARKINPGIVTCVRTHSYADAKFFEELGVERVVLGELELALEMAHFALLSFDKPVPEVDETIQELRDLGARALVKKTTK